MGFGLARIFNGLHWFFGPALPRADHEKRWTAPLALPELLFEVDEHVILALAFQVFLETPQGHTPAGCLGHDYSSALKLASAAVLYALKR